MKYYHDKDEKNFSSHEVCTYFEGLDLVVKEGFEQPGYSFIGGTTQMCAWTRLYSELQSVTDFYGSDFDPAQLGIQLQLLTAHFGTIKNDQGKITFKVSSISGTVQLLFSGCYISVVMPATNAAIECLQSKKLPMINYD